VAFAKVLLGPQYHNLLNSNTRPIVEQVPRGVEVETDRAGTFHADGVPVGRIEVRAWAAGRAPTLTSLEVPAQGCVTIALTLGPGAQLRGVARTPTGAPVAGAEISLGEFFEFVHAQATTAADGSYTLGDLPVGTHTVRAERGGSRTAERPTLAGGVATPWDPVLDIGNTLRGRVVDAHGAPLAGHAVSAWLGQDRRGEVVTGADGHFELRDLGAEPLSVEVSFAFQSLAIVPDVRPGGPELVVTLDDARRPNAFLLGRLVDEQGRPVAATLVPWHADSNRAVNYHSDATTGAYRIGPVRAGSYTLVAESAAFGRVPLGQHELAPNETRQLGDFVLPTPGGAEVAVTLDGRPATDGVVVFLREDGSWCETVAVEQGVARTRALPVGRIYAVADAPGLYAACELGIVAGGRATATLDLQRPLRATTTLVDPRGTAREALGAQLVARRPDGSFAGLFALVGRPDVLQFFVELPAGEYALRVTTKDGRTAVGRADLRSGPCSVTLSLP
ncbi:MAG: carboxypeptidase regulatory-like domain-containing protein, partial [Planctomycetes bacterium]|nr:carboxypeptidase regulatory-like domain-containing protein [Planctomycetota bacterium]